MKEKWWILKRIKIFINTGIKYLNRFSNGAAAYFYDTMDEMFKEKFKADLEADFAYFVGLSKADAIGDDPKGVD